MSKHFDLRLHLINLCFFLCIDKNAEKKKKKSSMITKYFLLKKKERKESQIGVDERDQGFEFF